MKLTQDTLQKENQDLRSIVTSMQMAVEEVLSMKALMMQALASGVTGGQQRSEPCAPLPKMDTDEHETDEPEPPVDEQ